MFKKRSTKESKTSTQSESHEERSRQDTSTEDSWESMTLDEKSDWIAELFVKGLKQHLREKGIK